MPPLRGKIYWTANDPTTPPGPVTPPPAGLWEPMPGITPANGDFVYLESEQGDWVGQGASYLYTDDDAQINVTSSEAILSIDIFGSENWSGDFAGMSHLNQLEAGYYGDLERFSFHNPVKGGLTWGGEGRGCNVLTGWFVVDSVTYDGSNLVGIEMRFEQFCDGDTGALNGQIRWSQ